MAFILGWLYCTLWYTSIFAGYAGLFCPLLPLLLVSNKLYRHVTDILFTFWQYYNTALLKYVCGCHIEVTGDCLRTNETSILIINHRTRTDWNFLWPTLYHCVKGRFRVAYSTKFVLKDIIKHIPGPGWVMQLSCFIYIKRCWEMDKKSFEKYVNYVCDISYKHSIIMFPEGTDLTENTKKSSDSFAEKNNLQKYEYVLHPRTTGFAYLAQKMMQRNGLDAVFDVTLMYPDIIPQNEKVLLDGKFPKTVRAHLVRYPRELLSKNEEGLREFLEQRWLEKENALKEFYTGGHFLKGNKLKTENIFELSFALLFWTVFPFVTLYCFFFVSNYRLIVILHSLFVLFVNYFFDGFQNFEIAVHNFKKGVKF